MWVNKEPCEVLPVNDEKLYELFCDLARLIMESSPGAVSVLGRNGKRFIIRLDVTEERHLSLVESSQTSPQTRKKKGPSAS